VNNMSRKAVAILRDIDTIKKHEQRMPATVYLAALAELDAELKAAYGLPAQEQEQLPLQPPQGQPAEPKKPR